VASGNAGAGVVIVTRRGYRREHRAHAPREQSFADRKQQTRALRSSRRYLRTVLESASFDVVLPVLDEALALPVVLADLPPSAIPLVVDNGSSDGSAAIARALGVRVVVEQQRGFGAACWSGLRAATRDVVCFMDCDGTFRGEDLLEVVAPVLDGSADLVLGARQGTTGWPLHARWANRALAFELGRRTGMRFTDLGPMRAVRREALLGLGVADRRSGWPLEMVLRAADAGWRIEERPVTYSPRIGRSKVTGTVAGSMRAVHDMAAVLR
jgi:glycosyltransferase involved in cell wall biosynthesis